MCEKNITGIFCLFGRAIQYSVWYLPQRMEVFNIYGIRSIIRCKSQQNAEQLYPLKEGSLFHPLDDVYPLVLTFSTHDSDFFRCKTCHIGTRLIVIDSTGAVIASRSIQNETSNTVTCLAIYLVFMYMNEIGNTGHC